MVCWLAAAVFLLLTSKRTGSYLPACCACATAALLTPSCPALPLVLSVFSLAQPRFPPPNVPRYARDPMTLAGGRRNVALGPLIPRLADAHLHTW